MTRTFSSIAAVLPILVGLSACSELEAFIPDVNFQRMEVDAIDFDGIDAQFVFSVDNPNPIRVGLSSFSYDFGLEGIDLFDGNNDDGFQLEAIGSSELALPMSLNWLDTYDTVQATRGEDQVGFGLAGHLGFDTPLGEARIPYDEAGEFPALRTPRFQFQRVRVERLNILSQEAELAIDLGIDNPHGSSIFFDAFQYDLDLGGDAVAAGQITQLGGVEGATNGTLTLPVAIDLVGVGAEVIQALTQRDPLNIGLAATMDVDTPFGVVPLSINETGNVSVQ